MKVSVIMLTYNHEKFIAQAIAGVLMQQVSFPIELIVADDHSTDRTREISDVFRHQNPGIIKGFYNETNLGPGPNFVKAFEAATGEYIALCEGDDYWTDPLKLQKQVDFLDAHPEYSLCSHGFETVDENNGLLPTRIEVEDALNTSGFEIGVVRYFESWITQTLTTMFRRSFVKIDFSEYSMVDDTILFFNLLLVGNGFFMSFNGGCYRIHTGGHWSSLKTKSGLKTSYRRLVEMTRKYKSILPLRNALLKKIAQILEYDMHSDNRSELDFREVFFFSREYFRYSLSKRTALAYLRQTVGSRLITLLKMYVRMKVDWKYRARIVTYRSKVVQRKKAD